MLQVFRYYHSVGDGWNGQITWYRCLATDLQMVKDFIETRHNCGKLWQPWREDTGCWLKTKPASSIMPCESYIIP